MVWIWQALYGRHLRWYEKMRKPRKLEKKPVPKWELVFDPVLDLKMGSLWSRNNL